jgi:hypothetical protein
MRCLQRTMEEESSCSLHLSLHNTSSFNTASAPQPPAKNAECEIANTPYWPKGNIRLTIMFGWLWSPHTPLSDEQAGVYASEKMENFRWASRIFGTHSSHTLTSTDLAPIELQEELAEIGQFAELAHGHLSPEFIWKHMDILRQPGFPLGGYDALPGSRLLSAFHGTVSNLQGYVAYRVERKQLVLAFSGTSSLSQSLHNLDAFLIRYPYGSGCAVHAGFWKMYNGLRTVALKQLAKAQLDCEVEEIVFTGHSLGAVMCCLLALDVMTDDFKAESIPRSSTPLPLKLVLFGSPRFGNPALAQYWEHTVSSYQRRHGEPPVKEYSVRAFNDGQILPRLLLSLM